MKLLIAEEALLDRYGHWFEYIKTISDGFRSEGDIVDIAANLEAKQDIVDELNAERVFPENVWVEGIKESAKLTRIKQMWSHNEKVYNAISKYIDSGKTYDVLFVPTILIDHVLGWRKFAKKYAGSQVKKLVLFFVNGQGIYQGPGKPILFDRAPNKMLFKQALSSLKRKVQEGSVHLACETREMAREYEAFCGLPFEYLPHPVDEAPLNLLENTRKTLSIASLGFSRYEKGSDLLQEAIKMYLNKRQDTSVKFVLQWVKDFYLKDGSLCSKDPELLNNPKVEYLTKPFNSEEYKQLLSETDIMILPYRLQSYYARVSRVAIEAAINSIPMIYTKNSWNESLVKDGHGAGEGFESENVPSLCDAIERAIDNYSEIKATATQNHSHALKHYSAETFQDLLKFMTGF
jgi:glycosyltransferase involved in cell wall biosynthesis